MTEQDDTMEEPLDELPKGISHRIRDEPVAGPEEGSLEIADPSPDLRKLIGIAQHLGKDELRKLLRYARRMQRGKDDQG